MKIFTSSKLPRNVLADVWSLCDSTNAGQLNVEQFALAMYLIANKVKGHDLPSALTPEMVPPSMRAGASGALIGRKRTCAWAFIFHSTILML